MSIGGILLKREDFEFNKTSNEMHEIQPISLEIINSTLKLVKQSQESIQKLYPNTTLKEDSSESSISNSKTVTFTNPNFKSVSNELSYLSLDMKRREKSKELRSLVERTFLS